MRDIALQCGGKERQTRTEAVRYARTLKEKGVAVQAYRCLRCGNWHVGHRPGQWRRNIMWQRR